MLPPLTDRDNFTSLSMFRYKDQGTTMRAMPFPGYISAESRDNLNVFYSVCQIFATSQVLFSYHLDEVFAGNYKTKSILLSTCTTYFSPQPPCYHPITHYFSVVLPIQIAALLMTMVRKSIISAGAWHYYYTLSLLSNYIVGPIAGWFNPAGKPPPLLGIVPQI